jgi:hypothetical protein
MPRRVFTVYATNEQDARDIAERRAREARLVVVRVDEVIDLDDDRTGLRAWVVWVSVK